MARRFVFALESLLRLRRLREEQAQRRVAEQRAELNQLAQLDRETEDAIRKQQAALLDAQQNEVLDRAGLAQGRTWIAHLQRMTALRDQHRKTILEKLQELEASWRHTRVERKAIEKLRERRQREHHDVAERREQETFDEVARRLHTDQQSAATDG